MIGGDDDRAVRYLLDELAEPEREAFEDEYFGDEGGYRELLAAEDELIDRYCERALSSDQQRQFEKRYLETAEGRERVEFARALKRLSSARAPQTEGTVAPAGGSRAALRWLPWVAVLVAALGALPFVMLQARHAREERAALQEELVRQQQRTRDQELRLAELSRQMARAQEQARTIEDLLGVTAAQGLRAASLALSAGLRRDAAALPRLTLMPDVSLVRLQLQLDATPRAAYRASLETPEGRELWSRDGLASVSVAGKPTLTFTVPAAVLAHGQHIVTLAPAGGRGDADAEYVFYVRREVPR